MRDGLLARARARVPGCAGARAGVLGLLLAVLVTGCGIRATSVPTDFGPAPSRAPCELNRPTVEAKTSDGLSARIFLVCSSQLVTVNRTLHVPSGPDDRAGVAQALLDELRLRPPTPERQAGYTTDVRNVLTVSAEPFGNGQLALRLGTSMRTLTAYALAQLVCTFAYSPAGGKNHTVILGGSRPDPLRRYRCTPEVLSRPGTTGPPSTPVQKKG